MTDKGRMTAGPWEAKEAMGYTKERGIPILAEDEGGSFRVAEAFGVFNARAIACLPELVEAARETLAAFDEDCHLSGLPTTPDSEKLRRILARIDGETGGDK